MAHTFLAHKDMYISQTVQAKAILIKFLTHRVYAECAGDLSKKMYSSDFYAHLEFLLKMQMKEQTRKNTHSCIQPCLLG